MRVNLDGFDSERQGARHTDTLRRLAPKHVAAMQKMVA